LLLVHLSASATLARAYQADALKKRTQIDPSKPMRA